MTDQPDRLSEIKARHSVVLGECVSDDHLSMPAASQCDVIWLVEEVERLRDHVAAYQASDSALDAMTAAVAAERDSARAALDASAQEVDALKRSTDSLSAQLERQKAMWDELRALTDTWAWSDSGLEKAMAAIEARHLSSTSDSTAINEDS